MILSRHLPASVLRPKRPPKAPLAYAGGVNPELPTGHPPLPRTASPQQVMRAAVAAVEAGQRVVMATVIRRRGSAPATPGQKLALLGRHRALGTIGGGALEMRVLHSLQRALAGTPAPPRVERFELAAALGMCCGGGVELMVEVLEPAAQVLLVGAGHIGSALAPLLDDLAFGVVVCDAREQLVAALPVQPRRIVALCADHDDPEVRAALGDALANIAMVVMTHDHQLDQRVVEWALRAGFGFVGGVGSRAKAARCRARLEAKAFAEADIARVKMPCGIDIHARLPAEIAVSIAAQLVRWRAQRLGRVKPQRNASTTAHPSR